MLALIEFFFDLCLLRKAPQDLPASSVLLWMTLGAEVLTGIMLAATAGVSPALGLSRGLADVGLMLGTLYAALYALNLSARFRQSATALLGSGTLLGFVAAFPLSLLPRDQETQTPAGATLLLFVLLVWSMLVSGHIVRHTFKLSLGQGVGVALAYNLLAYALVGTLVSGT